MKPEDVTPQDAPALLSDLNTPDTQRITDYLAGRWLGPEGQEDKLTYWTGPMLPPGHDEYVSMKAALLKAVAADNQINSSLETYLDAVQGLEDWRLVPDGQDAPDDKTDDEAAFTAYLDRLGFPGLLYRAGLTLAAHGRTVLRPILSVRARDEQGNVRRAANLAEALSRIHWQADGWPRGTRVVGIQNAGIVLDDDLEPFSVLMYSKEITETGVKRTVRGLEVSWVDAQTGLTQFKVMLDNQEKADPVSLDLGGRLMLVEATLPRAFVTKSMLGCMDSYVVASTMLNRNTHYAGYVERWAIGVQPPGWWEDAQGNKSPTPSDVFTTFKPAKLTTGPAMMNFYQPGATVETVTDSSGTRESERPTPAQVGRWEPVDPVAITAAIEHWRKAIRAEARQSFLELSDSADASGRSREVAAGDYMAAGQKLANAEGKLVRDVLELTAQLAALQLGAGDAARLRSYRATVDARVKAFPPSADERQQNLQEWKEGLVDRETATIRTGVTDPDPVMERAQAEAAQRQQDALAVAQPAPVSSQPSQPGFATGDRVTVKAGSEHHMGGMSMGGSGVVEIVSTPALGIRLDDMPDEVHKWYVAAELTPEGGSV